MAPSGEARRHAPGITNITGSAQRREIDVNSTTENNAATAALVALTDEELAAFVGKLDAALKEARLGPQNLDLNEATSVAATARYLLRSRRAAVASKRAMAIVRELISAEPA